MSRPAVRVLGTLLVLGWLVVFWVLLWGEVSAANVLGGLAVGAAVLVASPFTPVPRGGRVRPLAALRLFAAIAANLVRANLTVAWQAIHPRTRIAEGVVAVPIAGCSEALTTLVANAITLTPGTMVLDVDEGDPTVLYIHVLQLDDPEEVRADVRRLQTLAVRAFGGPDAHAALADFQSGRRDPAGGRP